MSILSIRNVSKQYHNHLAVDNVSFEMPRGSILGLLGPNGAGKTSLIRIITSITKADKGEILFDGEKLNLLHPERIGYLPEERGLYKKMKVGEQLIYLAQLKGMPKKQAKEEIEGWLEKFEMSSWWNKKVEELSKGMQQKVQFVSTIVHRPPLIILDEPFTGLDPLNSKLIKQEIMELNRQGTSIIFSTHRMEQVEEICEHIVLINKGQNILQGQVGQIKEMYKDHLFKITYQGSFHQNSSDPEVLEHVDNTLTIRLGELGEANQFIKSLMDRGMLIQRFEEVLPTLNDIFIKKVTEAA
ncbi:MAG: ATP-binding cassette domain-containing protein [Saprospiraceae bacterium]|nr:ATP-binding cassette domain-containing protein [Saprospiraceae bacterium]